MLLTQDFYKIVYWSTGNNDIANNTNAITAVATNMSQPNNLAIYQSSATLATLEQDATDDHRHMDVVSVPNNTILWMWVVIFNWYSINMYSILLIYMYPEYVKWNHMTYIINFFGMLSLIRRSMVSMLRRRKSFERLKFIKWKAHILNI